MQQRSEGRIWRSPNGWRTAVGEQESFEGNGPALGGWGLACRPCLPVPRELSYDRVTPPRDCAQVTKKIRAIEDKERQSYKKMFASAPKDVPKDAKAPEAPAEASNGGAAEAREGQPRAKAPEGAPRDARAEAAQEKARYGGMFDRVNLSADVESGPAAPKWTDAEVRAALSWGTGVL